MLYYRPLGFQALQSGAVPMCEPILGKMDLTNAQNRKLRVNNLSNYLCNMQIK
jgi:hypothetical protein